MENTPINFYIIWPLPLLPSSPACSIYSRSLASIQFFNNPNIVPTPASLHLLVPLPGSVVYLDVLCLDSPHPPGLCHLLEELHPPRPPTADHPVGISLLASLTGRVHRRTLSFFPPSNCPAQKLFVSPTRQMIHEGRGSCVTFAAIFKVSRTAASTELAFT